jgi:hypothetical protein
MWVVKNVRKTENTMNKRDMANFKYVIQIGVEEPEKQKTCIEAMDKYEDNQWWEDGVDPRKFAYYQTNEGVLLRDFEYYHQSLQLLLNRPVFPQEMDNKNRDALAIEVQQAWEKWHK